MALAVCSTLAGTEVARALGLPVPQGGEIVLGSAAAVLAATVAVRRIAFVRRGPIIVDFRREDGLLCDARESAVIRSAAQLRGTMGGAGHLFPHRLVLSSVAWAYVAVQAVLLVLPEHGAATFVPLAGVIVVGAVAARFPAIPFYYRETVGQCVVAFPVDACMRLLEAARLAPAPTGVELTVLRTGTDAEGSPAQPPGAEPPARREKPNA